ncbi:MAG: hypothetical protein ACRDMX_03000 [Solirubrobacteraceae bacterium]
MGLGGAEVVVVDGAGMFDLVLHGVPLWFGVRVDGTVAAPG